MSRSRRSATGTTARSEPAPGGGRAAALLAAPLATLALVALAACSAPSFEDTESWPTPEVGAVVSEHPLATQVGLDVLDAGGNAADAAVATALALAVVYPLAGNLGGGGFALFVPHDPQDDPERLVALDFRETAPRALTPDHFLVDGAVSRELATGSRLAAGVPGTPAGLWAFQRRLGRLPFAQVVRPALELARDGFPVDPWLAFRIDEAREKLAASGGARKVFLPGDEPLRAGALLVQTELADTLAAYSRLGPAGFYRGEVARLIVAEMQRGFPGVLDADDLAAYEPVWRTPLRGWFEGMEVLTMPPPSSGGVALLQVLAVLEGFPLNLERVRADGTATQPTPRALHWWIEAMRAAFADRAEHLGDPDHVDVPVDELLSHRWVNQRRVEIGESARSDVSPWVLPPAEEGDQTTHVSVLDRSGNAVSLTTTLNGLFGSGILVQGAGFFLNNEMDDFSIRPGEPNLYGLVGSGANQLAAGRRPLSSMTPTVVRDGGNTVAIVVGAPGGPRIITSVIQVLLRLLVHDQELRAAVEAPRLHQQWSPPETFVEEHWAPELLEGLRARGHVLRPGPPRSRWSSVQAIEVEPGGTPTAVSDPRRGGVGGLQGEELPEPSTPPARGD